MAANSGAALPVRRCSFPHVPIKNIAIGDALSVLRLDDYDKRRKGDRVFDLLLKSALV